MGGRAGWLASCDVCVCVVQCVMDVDTGEPKDELLPQVATALKALGCNLTKPSEIAKLRDYKVLQRIREGLDKANANAVSSAQKVNKWCVFG